MASIHTQPSTHTHRNKHTPAVLLLFVLLLSLWFAIQLTFWGIYWVLSVFCGSLKSFPKTQLHSSSPNKRDTHTHTNRDTHTDCHTYWQTWQWPVTMKDRKVVSSVERVGTVVNHLTTSLKFCWYDTKRGAVWPEPLRPEMTGCAAEGWQRKNTHTHTHTDTEGERQRERESGTGELSNPANKGQSQLLHSIWLRLLFRFRFRFQFQTQFAIRVHFQFLFTQRNTIRTYYLLSIYRFSVALIDNLFLWSLHIV